MACTEKGKLTSRVLFDLLLLFLFVQIIHTEDETCSASNCVQGKCVNGTCECDPGWAPKQCKHCTGIVRYAYTGRLISSVVGLMLF